MRFFSSQIFFLFSLLTSLGYLLAEEEFEIDVDNLFVEDDIVETEIAKGKYSSNAVVIKPKPVTFGGEINGIGGYAVLSETVFEGSHPSNNFFFSSIYMYNYLDIRLTKGIKSYIASTLTYIPTGGENQNLTFILNEAFIDFNINYGFFVRFGKQVSKWGRGVFWNPTDLINFDRKMFSDLERYREGSYGLKMHLPIGTLFNGYVFIGGEDLSRFENYFLLTRLEFLIKRLELGALIWLKSEREIIYGADFSFGVRGFNFYGEATFHGEQTREKNFVLIGEQLDVLTNRQKGFFAKVVLGGHKSFKQETINIGLEVYYNGEGQSENIFRRPLVSTNINHDAAYYAFDHSQWYGALFLSFSELFKNTTTLSLNTLVNFLDGSFLFSPWLVIEPVNYFEIAFNPVLRVGEGSFTELTFESSNPFNNVFFTFSFLLTVSF